MKNYGGAADVQGGSRPQHQLRQIFPEGEIYAVSDDELLGMAAARYGLENIPLAEASKVPGGANVVLFLRHSLVSAEARKMFRNAAVLVVPIASFDPALEVALYTQKLTMLTDYVAARERSQYWADYISAGNDSVVFSTAPAADTDDSGDPPPDVGQDGGAERTHLVCKLADELTADTWLHRSIQAGQWVGVGTLCEFSMTPSSLTDWSSAFTIDGRAVAAGVLAARDSRFTEDGDARIRAAGRLRDELTARRPVILNLDNGILTSIRAGGEDFTKAVLEVTNPQHSLHAIELGIGTNRAVLPHVDWTLNSQLNEGAGPIHLGFGDGITGAHLDFVIADSGYHFQEPATRGNATIPAS